NSGGSAYAGGSYGYVSKDLRTLRGQPVQGPYSARYCGAGDLAACRASLWAALDAAGNELAAAQGPDPAAWRADATRERISFGLLPLTMRWTNRPTFQQVMTFTSHRLRSQPYPPGPVYRFRNVMRPSRLAAQKSDWGGKCEGHVSQPPA